MLVAHQPVCLLPSSVGDAMCTISAASCFPEPFISEGRRLGLVHRNFAGSRFSDHVALLSVFQAWDDIRSEVTLMWCCQSLCVCVCVRVCFYVCVCLCMLWGGSLEGWCVDGADTPGFSWKWM